MNATDMDWIEEPTRTDLVSRLPTEIMKDLIAHGDDMAAELELQATQHTEN